MHKHIEVEAYLVVGCRTQFLQEIGGKGGLRHAVVAALADVHVRKVARSAAYHLYALGVWELAAVLLHHHHVEPGNLSGGLLYEIAVSEGEGIGVHHYHAALTQSSL